MSQVLETIVRRDRYIVGAGLGGVAVLAWLYIVHLGQGMSHGVRDGLSGALVMGARHGVHCVGCCWVLMALLFVAGVMNLVWVAALAGFVLIEKLAPHGRGVGRITGIGFVMAGLFIMSPMGR